MNVTFKLTAATSGTTASTSFNISGKTSSNVVSQLATGVTKVQLTTGHTINDISDAITGGTIASISPTSCTGITTTWSVVPTEATFHYEFNGGLYDFFLNIPINDDIKITIANVDGFTATDCGTASEASATLQGVVTLPAGQTTVSHDSGDGVSFTGITRVKLANAITFVGYSTKQNGQTFTTASGTVVTVQIDTSCQSYYS